MMARGPKLTFYIDTVSPFGYDAYWILRVVGVEVTRRGRLVFALCAVSHIGLFWGCWVERM